MTQPRNLLALSLLSTLLLGCQPSEPADSAPVDTASAQTSAAEVAPSPTQPDSTDIKTETEQPAQSETSTAPTTEPVTAMSADEQAIASVPESEKGEKAARKLVLTWALALENKQFDKAYALSGQAAAGVSAAQYAAQWQPYRSITVSVDDGQMDAGAGSLFYIAPVQITTTTKDGKTIDQAGSINLRRVNDVLGATPEQLRWHITQLDLASTTPTN